MSLKDDTQQNIQIQLDFSSGPTGLLVMLLAWFAVTTPKGRTSI